LLKKGVEIIRVHPFIQLCFLSFCVVDILQVNRNF
jgi:hypothetical protein